MTTIGTTPSFSAVQRYNGADRSAVRSDFTDQMEQATASRGEPATRLAELRAEAEALKKRQLQMSNTDYLLAKFTLDEKIGAERLNAGEELDTFRVRFEGRIFNLAGKMYDSGMLKQAEISQVGMVPVATPKERPGNG